MINLGHLYYLSREPPTLWQALPNSLLLALNNHRMLSVCVDLLLWTFYRKEVGQYMES